MPSTPQKIVPHLWFDKEAKEAAAFYVSVFPESQVLHAATLEGTPGGDADVVAFEIWGQRFEAVSAGPLFRPNPSISFIVNFDPLLFGKGASAEQEARRKLDEVWSRLSEGGKALMPLDKYPFSARYGWIEDRYGFSWQLMLTDPQGEPRPSIIPSLMFTGERCGQAREAIGFWTSVFRNSRQGASIPYPPGQAPNREGTVLFADFRIEGAWLAAMDSAAGPDHAFNEAVSLMIKCDSQAEIDYYWEKLSAVPEAEACGWLKDRFGVSWQVTPAEMDEMMMRADRERLNRVTQAFLAMKKFDLATLKLAYEGAPVP